MTSSSQSGWGAAETKRNSSNTTAYHGVETSEEGGRLMAETHQTCGPGVDETTSTADADISGGGDAMDTVLHGNLSSLVDTSSSASAGPGELTGSLREESTTGWAGVEEERVEGRGEDEGSDVKGRGMTLGLRSPSDRAGETGEIEVHGTCVQGSGMEELSSWSPSVATRSMEQGIHGAKTPEQGGDMTSPGGEVEEEEEVVVGVTGQVEEDEVNASLEEEKGSASERLDLDGIGRGLTEGGVVEVSTEDSLKAPEEHSEDSLHAARAALMLRTVGRHDKQEESSLEETTAQG
ncbi:unnamed protein product, partial [Discosporangium mesarthrocarpum]